ncbi:MAG: NmrA family NAD(P)-binding protein [Gemmatimonadota bacterium]
MSTLILGGTGTVGGAVVAELLARGESDLRVLTRSPEKAQELPKGAEGVVADLTDPTTFAGVFEGTERLFLLNPVAMTELHEGLTALEEAKRVGVGRLVYLSVHLPESGPHVPHFASKLAVERALRESGLAYTILQPNNFYQNDFWFRDAIVDHGVYPQPVGDRGIPRVDVRDIAVAAANALTATDSRLERRAFPLVGPEKLSGEDCARIWSQALGKPVAYGGNDLEAWEAQARQMLPAWMAYDFRIMYAMFHAGGFTGSPDDLNATEEIVGARPRSFEAFAREVAAGWK